MCGWFSTAVRSSDSLVSTDGLSNKKWVGKNVAGSSCLLIGEVHTAFTWNS